MTELADYLERLGLEQYVDAFISEGFDTLETLLDIQETDLSKLQRAIAEHRGVPFERIVAATSYESSPDGTRVTDAAQTSSTGSVSGASTSAETKRKYRRHPKPDEHAPERPPSAYVIFSNKVREEVKDQALSFTQIAKLVGERWQKLDTAGKEPYEAQANASKERYNIQFSTYKKTDAYKEYGQYLAEFKAKHGALGDQKRPRLEPESSGGSLSAKSAELQPDSVLLGHEGRSSHSDDSPTVRRDSDPLVRAASLSLNTPRSATPPLLPPPVGVGFSDSTGDGLRRFQLLPLQNTASGFGAQTSSGGAGSSAFGQVMPSSATLEGSWRGRIFDQQRGYAEPAKAMQPPSLPTSGFSSGSSLLLPPLTTPDRSDPQRTLPLPPIVMPAFSSLVAASLLASLALAKPVPQGTSTRKGFTINQSVAKPYKPGVVALAQVYNKYNKAVPEHVATAAASASSGEATATPEEYDEEYLVSVSVGGQDLNLDFDTGSADLWVFSSELSSSERSGHSYYTPSKSSTSSEESGETWSISYGDGSGASGNVYADTVIVGGVTVTSQAVEAATSISTQFQEDEDNDGLLGLAFSSINTVSPNPATTFFQTAIDQGVLAENVFTVDLKKGEPGTYDFGYIDSDKYTGDITYTAVDDSDGFWSFTSSGYGIGSGSFKSTSSSGIADTGTTLLLLDDKVVSAYYAEVDGAEDSSSEGGWVFSCDASLPDFIVGIGSARFTIPGTYINYAPVDSSGETCYGGIQSDSGIGFAIYGDIFLKAVFVVFDNDNLQLGVASNSTTTIEPLDAKNDGDRPLYGAPAITNGRRLSLTSSKADDVDEEVVRHNSATAPRKAQKRQVPAPPSHQAPLSSGRRAGAGWEKSAIRWAPLNVPLQRRLQMLAVLWHSMSIPLFLSSFLLLCSIPLAWPIVVPYLIYTFVFSDAHSNGSLSRRSDFLRRSSVWSAFASYFPIRLHRTTELEATRKYIFGYHPHGIISHGAFASFATEALGFAELFPGITNSLLTLESNFRIPFYREYILGLGISSVSRESIENILSKGGVNGEGMGRAVTIVVGGARESLDAKPGQMRLVLNSRKGFVKLAIRTGADLVPVLSFGENDLYDQVDSVKHPYIHKFQMLVKKAMGFTVPLFHARGIFNYDVGLMPYRHGVNVVVGKPIPVVQQGGKDGKVEQAYLDQLHAEYVQELRRLWDEYKDAFAPDREGELEII
ncbi:hypothetical protein DV737_g1754, partial [Chaetothyriales sp. CBS 132003]